MLTRHPKCVENVLLRVDLTQAFKTLKEVSRDQSENVFFALKIRWCLDFFRIYVRNFFKRVLSSSLLHFRLSLINVVYIILTFLLY